PVRSLRPDVPAGLAAVLDRMLAKDPAARYASPGEIAEALRPFAAPARPPRRGRVLQGLAGLAALVFLTGLAVVVPNGFRRPADPPGLRVVLLRVSHYRGKTALQFLGDFGLTSSAARTDDDVRVHA